MTFARRMFAFAIALFVFGHMGLRPAPAQEVKAAPGQFDFYVLNLSWAPEFCSNTQHLPEGRNTGASTECTTPHGFVLHGLWPQNANGTWPAYCSDRPGPVHPERNLDLTPDLPLLQHEWAKHGTCTTLSPETFFATARQAYDQVQIPGRFQSMDQEVMLAPDSIVRLFQAANPSFPAGSFVLSCGHNYLTAIEACFSKDDLHPIACQNMPQCHANAVKIAPEASSGIVQ